jgi:uncharacterized membrane protein YccC
MGQTLTYRIVFALNCFLAVTLALYVAFSLSLPNPWWAMVTVFLAQPTQSLVGAIWAKASYRVAGTAIGLLASLVMIPRLSNAPELMILALAGWIALCLYISLLDRTPRAYVFMLAGYTVALVGLPAATDPTLIFDAAVARSEEIVIGVLAIAVVHSIFLPRSVASVMRAKMDAILNDARSWVADGLRALTTARSAPISRSAAVDLTELNLLATNLKFEGEFAGVRSRMLRAMEERFIVLLPLTSAIEDRLRALGAEGASTSTIAPLMERIAIWVATADITASEQASHLTKDGLIREIENLRPHLRPESTWSELLMASLTGRLIELIQTWEECLVLRAALHDPTKQSAALLQSLPSARRSRPLHVDHGIAALSALVAAVTIIGLAIFTVAVQWESGPLAIGIAAVLCSLFAAADDPTPMARTLTVWFGIAFPFAVLYEFAILPSIDGFVPLAAALFPVIFAIGFFFAQPKHALKALAMAVGFSAGLALQPTFLSSFPAFMNAYIALLVGATSGLIGLSLARTLPVQSVIRRILRAGWRELAFLTASPSLPERAVWASRMLDRVGLLLPRLARAPAEQEWELVDALRDLRIGVGIIDLRQLCPNSDHAVSGQIQDILAVLGTYFRRLARGRHPAFPQDVIVTLDGVIASILRMTTFADRCSGVVAAVGLRRSLFPDAPAYQPMAAAEC